MSLDDFLDRAVTCLGSIDRRSWAAKKIADFRPAFAEMFADFIKPYEFWGHTDHDIFFGDLAGNIPRESFDRYDVIGSSKRRICGPFTMYRNTPKLNGLWREDPQLVTLMKDVSTQCFLEEDAFSKIISLNHTGGHLRWLPRVARHGHPGDKLRYSFVDGRILVHGATDRLRALARLRSTERLLCHFRTWAPRVSFDPFEVRGWVIGEKNCTPF